MSRHRIAARLSLAGLGLLVLTACTSVGDATAPGRPRPEPTAVSSARPPTQRGPALAAPPALRVLHRWDGRRSRAYATGSIASLRDLYVAGCRAGAVDVRLLGEYAARGYRVRGMRMQVLAVDVLAHERGRWRLRVTDRLDRAVAVGNGVRAVLPRDQPSTRVLELARGADGDWRMASVRPVS